MKKEFSCEYCDAIRHGYMSYTIHLKFEHNIDAEPKYPEWKKNNFERNKKK